MDKKAQWEIAGGGFLIVLLLVVVAVVLSVSMVEASHQGVKVNLGTIEGVQMPGIEWVGPLTHVYTYDLRVRQTHVAMEGALSAPDKSGQPIFADIDVNYKLKPDAIIDLYRTVGPDDEAEAKLLITPIITEGFKRATVKYDSLELLSKREEVAHLAEQNIRDRFPQQFFDIDTVVISNIRYSDQFQKAIDDKKTAEQQTLVEKQNLEKIKFEQQQEIEVYKAEAEKIKLQSQQLTALTVQKAWIEKWSGQLPLYMLTSQENANMLLQLPTTPAVK